MTNKFVRYRLSIKVHPGVRDRSADKEWKTKYGCEHIESKGGQIIFSGKIIKGTLKEANATLVLLKGDIKTFFNVGSVSEEFIVKGDQVS